MLKMFHLINFCEAKNIMKYSKNRNKINLNNTNLLRKKIINLNSIMIIFIIISFFTICTPRKFNMKYSYINLVTNGTEYIRIISGGNKPDQIYINNIAGNPKKQTHYFSPSENSINNVTLVFNNTLTKMNSMFSNCFNIIEMDLSHLDTSQVTTMYAMLSHCTSLKSLNLQNINTSQVNNMACMFSGCELLESIDLSNFDTSQVTSMSSMFAACSSLTSLNLSNFDTSNVIYLSTMFNICTSLKSLDLSNFNVSNVISMASMFNSCPSITSINLPNLLKHKLET